MARTETVRFSYDTSSLPLVFLNEWKVKIVGNNGSIIVDGTGLALCSPLLCDIFKNNLTNDVIVLPDFGIATLNNFASLMGKGEAFGNDVEMDDLQQLMVAFKMLVKGRSFSVDRSKSFHPAGSRSERKRSAEAVTYGSFRDLKIARVETDEDPEIITISDDEDYDSDSEHNSPPHNASDEPTTAMPGTKLKLYRCSICNYTLCSKRLISSHRRSHFKENALCKFCGVKFVNVLDKLNHICTPTESVQIFSCFHCHKQFCEESLMLVHQQQHIGAENGENLQCPRDKCTKTYQSLLKLLKHVRRHTKEHSHILREEFFPFSDRSHHNVENAVLPIEQEAPLQEITVSPHHNKTNTVVEEQEIPAREVSPAVSDVSLVGNANDNPPTDELCCPACTEIFASGQDIIEHDCTMSMNENAFICDICFKYYPEEHVMLIHKQQHNENEKQKCPLCTKKIPPVMHMLRHVKKHLDGSLKSPLQVRSRRNTGTEESQNSYAPDSNTEVQTKTASHPDVPNTSPRSRYLCKLCNTYFDTTYLTFFLHIQQHQDIPIPQNACAFCNIQFPDQEKHIQHISVHIGYTSATIGSRTCGICNLSFPNNDDYLYHNAQHHVQYACPVCPEKSQMMYDLINHLVEQRFELDHTSCSQCPTISDSIEENLIHQAQFHGKSMHTCLICSMKHDTDVSASQHLNQHFVNEIKCKDCKIDFSSKLDFNIHKSKCGKNASISRITQAFSKSIPTMPTHFFS